MHSKYNDMFHSLIKAYYDDNFDETLTQIMGGHDASPQETFAIIASLCGVDLKYDNNYVYNLKKAITHYKVNEKLIEKLNECNTSCQKNDDGKFPCMMTCPFDAISYDQEATQTVIDSEKCLGCGLCVNVCSSARILEQVQFIPVIDLIKNNQTVIAAVAPAIVNQFGEDVSMEQLREAFVSLGFSDMIEVAFAADILTINEAIEYNKHVNSPKDFMITSCCCPMWVGMLKKVYKNLVPDLSPSVSPMIAAGRIIKSLNKDAKVVFIGPCIAKKAEAKEKDLQGAIDFVLNFQEVDEIFKTLNIKPSELNGLPAKEYASRQGRIYARSGGVSYAVSETIKELYPEKYKDFKHEKAEGVVECKALLNKALNGEIDATFIEGMGCKFGCVGGPKVLIPPEKGRDAVNNFAFNSPIKVPTHSEVLDNVLSKLNITSLKDFEDHKKIEILHREF